MFEGWLSDLLAAYLGHFLEINREQLRVSLWSGAPPRGSVGQQSAIDRSIDAKPL